MLKCIILLRTKIDLKIISPADFIAEGVDQTRGWFFTMHAIATMLFDSVSYKTCISNGLVLDKEGNKMSKRLGNAVDPFMTIEKYGPDATRWYMITNAQPWDNLKFNLKGIAEVQRKFFGTIYNTYAFFVLYANIDGQKVKSYTFSETLSGKTRLKSDNSFVSKGKIIYFKIPKGKHTIEIFTDEELYGRLLITEGHNVSIAPVSSADEDMLVVKNDEYEYFFTSTNNPAEYVLVGPAKATIYTRLRTSVI